MAPLESDECSVESSFHDYDDDEVSLVYVHSDDSVMGIKKGGVLPLSTSCESIGSNQSSIDTAEDLCEGMEDMDIADRQEPPMKIDISPLKIDISPLKNKTSSMKRSGSNGKMKRSGSNGKMKRSGSNGSIKEFLPIGSISEDTELRNEVFSFSSDEESSSADDCASDEESECSDTVSVRSSSTMGSEGFAIMNILKHSDSRDYISGKGHRDVKSCDKESLSADPLINLYLKRARLTGNKKSKGLLLTRVAVKNDQDLDIESILRKSDSKNHINNRGKRVVGSCAKKSSSDDPLIALYLNKTKISSNEDANIESVLKQSDSRGHIKGKGKRIVHSRGTKKSTDDPLIKRYLSKSKQSNKDAEIESNLNHSDSRNHIKGKGNRVVHSRTTKVSPNGLSLAL
jgi:hypothetical protein